MAGTGADHRNRRFELHRRSCRSGFHHQPHQTSAAYGALSTKFAAGIGAFVRITQDMLIKIAKDHVAKRIRREKDLVAVYLTGSVSEGEPLLGGSTDIDLIFVHKEEPPLKREVLRVTYEISLDIEHHHQSFYTYHRRLRQNPRIGFSLCNHQNILLDHDHWLEFIQASVSSRFDSPENVYGRSEQFGESARTLWFDLDDPQEVKWEDWMSLYFKT